MNLAGQGADRALVLLQIVVIAAVFGTSAAADLYFLAGIVPLTIGVIVGDPLGRVFLTHLVRTEGRAEGAALAAAGLAATLLFVGALTLAYLAVVLPLVRLATPAGTGALGPWVVFALVAPTLAAGTYLGTVLLWVERYAWPAVRLPLASAAGLVLLLATGLAGGGVVWAAASIAGGHALAAAVLYTRVSAQLGWRWPLGVTRSALRSALAVRRPVLAPVLGGAVGGQVIVMLERILAATLGAGAVATISYARGIAGAPALVSQALGAGVYPGMVRADLEGADEYLRRSFAGGLRLTLLSGTVLAAYLALFGPAVSAFALARGELGTDAALRTGDVLVAFAPATLASGLIFYLVSVLYGIGDFAGVLHRSLAVFAAYVLVAPALGLAPGVGQGLIGLALAFALAQTAGVGVALRRIARRLGLSWRELLAEGVVPVAARAGAVVALLAAYRVAADLADVPVAWRGVVYVGGSALLLLAAGGLALLTADLPEARRMRELARRLPLVP